MAEKKQLITEETYDEMKLKLIEKSDYEGNKTSDKLSLKFWVLLTVFICLVGLNAFQYFEGHTFYQFMKIVFLDKNDRFQWAGVTAITAIISLVGTLILTIHRNRADLVSKSRIEWLQTNKKIMADYIKLSQQFYALFKKWETDIKIDWTEELEKELESLKDKAEKDKYILLMNLSDNKDNMQINNCIIVCFFWLQNLKEQYDDNATYLEHNHDKAIPIINLLKVSRDYYKREWNKAKRGK